MRPAPAPALLAKLAAHMRELGERQGWTQERFASVLRVRDEDVSELERSISNDSWIAADDVGDRQRRRRLHWVAAAFQALGNDAGGWSDQRRATLRDLLSQDERKQLVDLLASDDPVEWRLGIRFATFTGDPAALPLLRELANAPAWSVASDTRRRAAVALVELGAPTAGRAGALAIADASEMGSVSLAEAADDDAVPPQPPSTLPRFFRSARAARSTIPTAVESVASVVATLSFGALVAFSAFMVVVGVIASRRDPISTAVFCLIAIVFGVVVPLLALRFAVSEVRDAFLSWTRRRWARNRAQRLRGS